jgi:hypothetical protein
MKQWNVNSKIEWGRGHTCTVTGGLFSTTAAGAVLRNKCKDTDDGGNCGTVVIDGCGPQETAAHGKQHTERETSEDGMA